jgi:hypothetical protein
MIATISKLLYESTKNLMAYTKFSMNLVGVTTEKLQYPSFTRDAEVW